MSIVKNVITAIAEPLTYIFNPFIKTHKFSQKMKIVKVIPLYKTEVKYNFTNYRSVSIISQFSEILEKPLCE